MGNKPDHYYRQSAVIPYLYDQGGTKVLLITTLKSRKWTLPKGIVEPGLSPWFSALKEAFEEAGIRGEVEKQVFGRFEYFKWGGTCSVEVFLMRITQMLDKWPEQQRDRCLVDPCAAQQIIGRAEMKPLLREFCARTKSFPDH